MSDTASQPASSYLTDASCNRQLSHCCVRMTSRMETLTEKIPALDNLPRTASELGEESELANELREAKTVKDLSETQLAELAELQASESRMDTLMAKSRALGHIPRPSRGAENALSQRLYIAKRNGQLSESQLAELAEIARCSVEPVRKRLRVLNDDVCCWCCSA